MGRIVGLLAGLLAVARVVVDAAQLARDVRADRAQADAPGAPDVGGPAEAGPPDRTGGVGLARPAAGARAGEDRPGPDEAVSAG